MIENAIERFKIFHLKEPDKIIELKTRIPPIVFPIGYCSQISYYSNKWSDRWEAYIHWWENPTLVCVSDELLSNLIEEDNCYKFHKKPYKIGNNIREVVFLGYAIDFTLTEDDRSNIDVGPATVFVRNRNPQSNGEKLRLRNSITFEFNSDPEKSRDYVCSSPSGNLIYVISDAKNLVFAFLNRKCKVLTEGITG